MFGSHVALNSQQLCVECHQGIGSNQSSPHTAPDEWLSRLTSSADRTEGSMQVSLASSLLQAGGTVQLACVSCHHEHLGREHNLTQIADDRCQVCHQAQFESFEHGHADFLSFGHRNETTIAFNHATHFVRYFRDDAIRLMPNATSPGDCNACHATEDGSGQVTTGRYSEICGSCHDDSIVDRSLPGLPLLAIAQEDRDTRVADAKLVAVEPLLPQPPGLIDLLLRGSPDTELGLSSIDDRRLDDPDSFLLLCDLIADSSTHGDVILRERLPIEWHELVDAPGLIGAIRLAATHWLGGSSSDGDGEQPELLPTDPVDELAGGGAYARNADLTIRYHPQGHADAYLKAWIEVAVAEVAREETARPQPSNDAPRKPPRSVFREMLEILREPHGAGTVATRGPISTGRCLSCHRIDGDRSQFGVVEWTPNTQQTLTATLTRFDHRPHVSSQQLLSGGSLRCQDCHVLDDSVESSGIAPGVSDPMMSPRGARLLPTSGFRPLTKNACDDCHNGKSGLQTCTTCHAYHARDVDLAVPYRHGETQR